MLGKKTSCLDTCRMQLKVKGHYVAAESGRGHTFS